MSDSKACTPSQVKALADRLNDHAEHIVNSAAREMQNDFRLAALVLRRMIAENTLLREEIARIAADCKDGKAAACLTKVLENLPSFPAVPSQ